MKQSSFKKLILTSLVACQILGCAKASITKLFEESFSSESPQSGGTLEPAIDGFRLDEEVKKFKLRYGFANLQEKLTDNRGDGDEALYGTRNFRVVLHGVMYRGGANNTNLETPRSNTNPLPTVGLTNLCREDFGAAIYLYSENFEKAPKSVSCKNTAHQNQTLIYKQYAAAEENEKILGMVYDRIKGKLSGPVYAHCWNGWHSSGLIAGMALKQFCGWSNARVDDYWVKNTDGNSAGFTTIRQRLKDFKPLVKYSITSAERALICPE
ncbi:hypothetical protein [uncultured Bdellovibrio sp.]|uniref:hypothetical protein n=1 Tax=Bdellovibrio sp. HCB-162 TaxID=3394234 RepID=UPI0025F5BF71|nr:hypothetical protein [uncultured Bdellovibrio sp.]